METKSDVKPIEKDWALLPNDLLTTIMSLVSLDNVARARCVCKAWKSIKLPSWLLMFIRKQSPRCSFYNPICGNICWIDFPELSDAIIRFSNAGWLLMSRGDRSMFFFNPFTKEKINLPDLPIIHGFPDLNPYLFKAICFFSSPTSSNCTVVGIYEGAGLLLLISRGEDSWNMIEIYQHPSLDQSQPNILFANSAFMTCPLFHNGGFYFLCQNGRLAVYNPKVQTFWRVLDRPEKPCNDIVYESYIVECDGNLVSVFIGYMGKWVSVFKLNESEMCWEKVNDLGDNMLFVSRCACFSAKKEVDGMQNKVYFPRFYGGEGLIYSLKTNTFESFGRKKKDLDKTNKLEHCSWIETSSKIHTEMELNWITSPKDQIQES